MIFSITLNYLFGLLIDHKSSSSFLRRLYLVTGIISNLGILIYYKYFNFLIDIFNSIKIGTSLSNEHIMLPIGISFFTFQSISYLIDVYRKTVASQKNILNLGLYISLFPQLIAGPIVRYVDIQKEILKRTITKESFTDGILKFIRGLFKKIIIANNVGFIADQTFSLPVEDLGSLTAWIAILCYSLQIYFDFSGYSDMAIGLGRMFGFNFKENFKHPYISISVKEFWRRWHISLSTWFRDYLYIPLGGNRKSKFRNYLNLIIVFFITGLWHGASWNFIIWGLYHGLFLLLEKNIYVKLPKPLKFLNHAYLILVVIIGWVFFRAENLTYALKYVKTLFSFNAGNNNSPLTYISFYTTIVFIFGIILSTPIRKQIFRSNIFEKIKMYYSPFLKYFIYFLLLLYSILELIQSNYNPFIYFRF